MNPLPTQAAWIAGILDGEGSFYAKVSSDGAPLLNPTLRVRVRMCNPRPILMCKELTGLGSINGGSRTSTGRRVWEWTVCTGDVPALLDLVEGHLVVKAEQALLFRKLADTALEGGCVDDELIKRRAFLKEKLSILNHTS